MTRKLTPYVGGFGITGPDIDTVSLTITDTETGFVFPAIEFPDIESAGKYVAFFPKKEIMRYRLTLKYTVQESVGGS